MKHALIVDDDPTARQMAFHMLQALGYQGHAVNGGDVALLEIKNNEYDVVLMDWQMPKLSGRDTVYAGDSLLKHSLSERRQIPVIIYSGCAFDLMTLPICHHLQVKAYLSKKLSPYEQTKRLAYILHTLESQPMR